MNRHYRKGANFERKLIQILESKGFACIRSAGSKKVDILAGNGVFYIAFEVKVTSKDTISIPAKDLFRTKAFCEKFGCIPILAFKIKRENFKFVKINDMNLEGKTITLTPKDGIELDLLLSNLMSSINQAT